MLKIRRITITCVNDKCMHSRFCMVNSIFNRVADTNSVRKQRIVGLLATERIQLRTTYAQTDITLQTNNNTHCCRYQQRSNQQQQFSCVICGVSSQRRNAKTYVACPLTRASQSDKAIEKVKRSLLWCKAFKARITINSNYSTARSLTLYTSSQLQLQPTAFRLPGYCALLLAFLPFKFHVDSSLLSIFLQILFIWKHNFITYIYVLFWLSFIIFFFVL